MFSAGQRTMDASALVEYFQPLTDWLKAENAGIDVTWHEDCPDGSFEPTPPPPTPEGAGTVTGSITIVAALTLLTAFVIST